MQLRVRLVEIAKKAGIKRNELEDLVDTFEASRMLVQPRPAVVGIENGYIRVSYDASRIVKPLVHSDLFTSFAKLAAHGDPSDAKIRSWVARFGLPKQGLRPEPEVVAAATRGPHCDPMSMGMREFREEARYAHELLSLYVRIRGRDATSIVTMVRRMRSRIRSSPNEASALYCEFLERYRTNQHSLLTESGDYRTSSFRAAFPAREAKPGIEGTRVRHRDFTDMVHLLSAQSALGDIITKLVSNVQLRVGVQRGEGLAASWYCPDLYSAIYLQFYLLVTRSKPIAYCKNPPCRQPFTPDSSKHVYCSDSCRSNARHYPKPDTTLTPPETQGPETTSKP